MKLNHQLKSGGLVLRTERPDTRRLTTRPHLAPP